MVKLPHYTCKASKEAQDHRQFIKLMQFLMGLDDVFQPVRTTLLISDPLPTIQTAFAILSREESHRNSSIGLSDNNTIKSQSSAFASKVNSTVNNVAATNSRFAKGPNPNLKCSKCLRIGHTIDR